MTSVIHLAGQPAEAKLQITSADSQKPPLITTDTTPEDDLIPVDSPEVEEATALIRKRPGPTLTTLPPEIHLLIAQHLIYPDALSLKHANRYFYRLVDTGVRLKVEWLMERRLLHLECPSDQRCDLGSDLRFCRGSVKYVVFTLLFSLSLLFFSFPFMRFLFPSISPRSAPFIIIQAGYPGCIG
jgi:hypothetical protein